VSRPLTSPIKFAQLFSEGPLGLGNPLVEFHLLNLLYRFKFPPFYSQVLFNNYQFWNYRALRQYLLWLTRIDVQAVQALQSLSDPKQSLTLDVVVDYSQTLYKESRRYELLEDIVDSQSNEVSKLLNSFRTDREAQETIKLNAQKLVDSLLARVDLNQS